MCSGEGEGEGEVEDRPQQLEQRQRPSKRLLRYQDRVEQVYTRPTNLPEGAKVDGVVKDFRDMILLNAFMNKHGMSNAVCDELLQLVQAICENHGWKWAMYKDGERLKQKCERIAEGEFNVLETADESLYNGQPT